MSELSDKLNSAAVKSCSLKEALNIFDLLADRKDIAFGFIKDGCYARAHIMCELVKNVGYTPLKSWAFESDKKLTVELDDGNATKWWYHVAMALAVTQEDGKIEKMVFDPGLFDGPVTLEEWGEVMGASKNNLEIIGYNTPPKGYTGSYNTIDAVNNNTERRAREIMEEFLQLQPLNQRVVFASQYRQQLNHEHTKPKEGKTWRTSEKQFSAAKQSPTKKGLWKWLKAKM